MPTSRFRAQFVLWTYRSGVLLLVLGCFGSGYIAGGIAPPWINLQFYHPMLLGIMGWMAACRWQRDAVPRPEFHEARFDSLRQRISELLHQRGPTDLGQAISSGRLAVGVTAEMECSACAVPPAPGSRPMIVLHPLVADQLDDHHLLAVLHHEYAHLLLWRISTANLLLIAALAGMVCGALLVTQRPAVEWSTILAAATAVGVAWLCTKLLDGAIGVLRWSNECAADVYAAREVGDAGAVLGALGMSLLLASERELCQVLRHPEEVRRWRVVIDEPPWYHTFPSNHPPIRLRGSVLRFVSQSRTSD